MPTPAPVSPNGELDALNDVIFPALEEALKRRQYRLQQAFRATGTTPKQQRAEAAHEKLRKLVYKLAYVCREIDHWDKQEPVGMGKDVDVFLEGLLEEILVRVEPAEDEEGDEKWWIERMKENEQRNDFYCNSPEMSLAFRAFVWAAVELGPCGDEIKSIRKYPKMKRYAQVFTPSCFEQKKLIGACQVYMLSFICLAIVDTFSSAKRIALLESKFCLLWTSEIA